MTTELTPGRYRGLKCVSLAEADVFGIVAFDQRGSYRSMMPPDADFSLLAQVKSEIIGALSREASAVLTDPVYGLSAAMGMSGGCGLLLAVEKSGYAGETTARHTELLPGWTVEKIRKAGADAVKLMVYYHPGSGALAERQQALISAVVSECHRWDLPVFLEPMSYSIQEGKAKDSPEFAAERAQVVIETARQLSRSGADALKLEFPLDIQYDSDENSWREACARLSEAATVPWVLLSAGVDFERFERQARLACECGASGFLAGRAIWKEGAAMPPEQRGAFLAGVARDRLLRLLEIAAEQARPWSDFYAPPSAPEGWYHSYS